MRRKLVLLAFLLAATFTAVEARAAAPTCYWCICDSRCVCYEIEC